MTTSIKAVLVGMVFGGILCGQVRWRQIVDPPATYAPSAHAHIPSDITGLQAAVRGYLSAAAPLTYNSESGQVGFATQAEGLVLASPLEGTGAPAFRALTWPEIDGKPSTFAPSAHAHIAADLPATTVYTTGSYADPAWITSLAKSKVGLTNVEDTALSTWPGSTNITTLGTVTTGSFPAANVSGLSDLLSGKEPTITAGSAGQYFRYDKTWGAVQYSELGNVPSTFTPSNHTHAATDINDGTLPLARGGTNQTTWTNGRCVQVSSDGTKLESASAACGSGGEGGGMVYPGSGVAVSTGSAWATSLQTGTSEGNLILLASGGALPAVSAANLTSFPTLNQNTTGTAAGLTAQYIDWAAASGGASIANKPTLGALAAAAYPTAGVPNSTGSAWGTSYTVGTSANNLVQLNGSAQLPALSAELLTGLPLTTGVTGILPVGNGGTGLSSGTSGGIPYFSSTSAMQSSAALTANAPVLGGGAGNAPTTGTRSGNTTEFATVTGTKTTGKQLAFDANGNVVASEHDTGGGGGGGGTGSYSASFTSSTSWSIPGSTHALGTCDLTVSFYETSGTERILLHPSQIKCETAEGGSQYSITISWATAQAGRAVLVKGGGASTNMVLVPWQVGAFWQDTPGTGVFAAPMPINQACGNSIESTRVSVTALTKGSGAMSFNVNRYSANGTLVGSLFASDQSYSNTGDNRQGFTPNQNATSIGATDYFRVNFVTVNGQDDLSVTVQGRCNGVE